MSTHPEAATTDSAGANEEARLAALHRYDILDTPDEEGFDRLVHLARAMFGTPIAELTLIDPDRQWIKARVPDGPREAPRDWSFCTQAIQSDDVMVVLDAASDPRVNTSPFVSGPPFIRFYAGAPMRTPDGHGLGTVCIVDLKPRDSFTDEDKAKLQTLADVAVTELELRRRRREEGNLLNRLLENSIDCVKLLELDGSLDFINGVGEQVLGLPNRTACRGQSWPGFWEGEERARVEAALAEARAGRTARLEVALADAQGEPRWWDVTVSPVLSEDGEPQRLLAISRDVTERRHAEEALRVREEQLRLVVDSATDYAILTTDPERRVTSWSAGARDALGYVAEEILGQPGDILFVEEDQAAGVPQQETGTALSDGCAPDVRWHRRKDGSRVFLDGTNRPLFNSKGEHLGFLKIARDESERRRAEERLQESEAKFQAITDSIDQMIWSTRPDGYHDYYNARWYEFTGMPPGSTDGDGWNELFHPDDQERAWALWRRSLDTGEPYHIEYRLRHHSGEYRWVIGRAQCTRDSRGRITRWFGTCTDIQEIVEAREVLARSRDELEAKIASRTAELLRTEDALRQSQKMEAIGQLTGGVAHDFNNLLTIIRSAADLMRRPGLPEERRRRYVDAIADTVDRAAKLTRQLLAFARRQALSPQVFDAAEQASAVADMLGSITGALIDIRVERACDRCLVEADLSQFETALVNLGVNARDAMDGEGCLTIRIEETTEQTSPESAPISFVVVTVSDTGVGIAADKLGQIFEPFFTTKEVGRGTGLGLSQVYGFAKQSGGDVRVESAPGQGATFRLFLPRASGNAALPQDPRTAVRRVTTGGGRRVLVVEDNVEVGTFSMQLLNDLGYQTEWAADAEEALRLLKQGDGFDAVFSDVVMPGMDGVAFANEVRRLHPELPIILTSGYSHVLAEEGRHGFELLQKPYAVEELSRALRRKLR